jgi:hypothetical protein
VTVGEQRVVAAGGAGDVRPYAGAAAQCREDLVGGAQPGGDDRAPLRLVAVEQRLVGPVVPGQRELPGEVVGVPQALVEPLGAERAEEVGGVPGEEDPPRAPAAGQPVVDGVDTGVEQLVRRGGAAAPAREARA